MRFRFMCPVLIGQKFRQTSVGHEFCMVVLSGPAPAIELVRGTVGGGIAFSFSPRQETPRSVSGNGRERSTRPARPASLSPLARARFSPCRPPRLCRSLVVHSLFNRRTTSQRGASEGCRLGPKAVLDPVVGAEPSAFDGQLLSQGRLCLTLHALICIPRMRSHLRRARRPTHPRNMFPPWVATGVRL